MLLGYNHEILLNDFGITILSQHSVFQQGQDMAGTIAYMAPEQVQVYASPASDQCALGIVVYEWLGGDRPFHGSFPEIALKHTLAPPPPLRERVPTMLPAVDQVVLRALAKDPKRRFASVQDFALALEVASRSESPGQMRLPHTREETTEADQRSSRTLPMGIPPLRTLDVRLNNLAVQRSEGTWNMERLPRNVQCVRCRKR